ncbi:MAG: DNA cytosine methyltransferase [Fuerstiella sp.]
MPSLLTAIDLFAGAGGLSEGLRQAGFDVRAAVELDHTSASSYRLNHGRTKLKLADIRKVTGPALLKLARLRRGELSLLTGCPPCQGFSSLQRRRSHVGAEDPRNELVFEVLRLVRSLRPAAVVMENVPGLKDNYRFDRFSMGLKASGYSFEFSIINAKDFGVPQRRKRLVLIAFRDAAVPQGWAQHRSPICTVRDAISSLPKAGQSGDPLHDYPERRSARVLSRIEATPIDGGSRKDIPAELGCDCHESSDGYHDVYGRMSWDAESPTITSGCTNPSKGRFIHPEENRAITLREAALLQSFPLRYLFDLSRGKEHVALQIGNAFPPRLIRPIARTIRTTLKTCYGQKDA